MADCEGRRAQLEAVMKELEMKEVMLKFHQTPSSIRYPGAPDFLLTNGPVAGSRLGAERTRCRGAPSARL